MTRASVAGIKNVFRTIKRVFRRAFTPFSLIEIIYTTRPRVRLGRRFYFERKISTERRELLTQLLIDILF